MGGRVKVIREKDYPPDARTPEERFEHLAKRAFAADPEKVRTVLNLPEKKKAGMPPTEQEHP